MLYINTEDHITVKTNMLRLIPFEAAIAMIVSLDSNLNNAIAMASKSDIEPALAAFHLKTIIPKVKTNIGILAMNISIVVVLEIKLKIPSKGKCIYIND